MVHETSGSQTAFPCNTCSLSFDKSVLQRSHMRSAWHLYNLQRKISGLSAQSEAEFHERLDKSTSDRRKKSRHSDSIETSHTDPNLATFSESDSYTSGSPDPHIHDSEQTDHSSTSPSQTKACSQCLFCALISPSIHANIAHMSHAHSFFLPSTPNPPAAVEPLLSYLSLLVYTYHECIYCGREKHSVHGVQSHMRDKAHCKLDGSLYEEFFSRGEEEDGEDGNAGVRDGDEGRAKEKTGRRRRPGPGAEKQGSWGHTRREEITQCGQRVRSRNLSRQLYGVSAETTALPATAVRNASVALSSSSSHFPHLPLPPAPPNGRNAALSLAGLSNAQLVSLAALDKKMRRQQVSAQKRGGYMALRQPVKAIYYKTENPVYQAG